MSAGVTDYGRVAWLDVLFNGVPAPSSYYVALLTREANEGYDGSVLMSIEPVGGGYGRKVCADWSSASSGFLTNVSTLDFGIPTEDWGSIVSWALCSADTAGQVFAYGDFTNPQFVSLGNVFILRPGALTVTLSGPTRTIVM